MGAGLSAPTISDLLSPPTADAVESLLLAYISVAANKVTDWNSGAVQLTMLKIEMEILADLVGPGSPPALQGALAGLLANGYPDSAAGDSLKTIATGWYGLAVASGSFAVQTVTLVCDASHGPYTFSAGMQDARASDGAVYVVAGSGTLTSGSSITLDFNARSIGLAKALISAIGGGGLPGVTVQSAAIKVSGGVPQFGSDPDTDLATQAAIAGRFPDLSAIGTDDRVIIWAKASDPTITRRRLDPDQNLAGGAVLTVASSAGPVSGGAVAAAAAYILVRQPITDNVSVNNASAVGVTPGGTVTIAAGRLVEAQAAADAAWAAYLATSQIGASVYLLQLIKAVMDAGADNFVSPTLNGLGQDQGLAPYSVPVATGTLTALLTWVTA